MSKKCLWILQCGCVQDFNSLFAHFAKIDDILKSVLLVEFVLWDVSWSSAAGGVKETRIWMSGYVNIRFGTEGEKWQTLKVSMQVPREWQAANWDLDWRKQAWSYAGIIVSISSYAKHSELFVVLCTMRMLTERTMSNLFPAKSVCQAMGCQWKHPWIKSQVHLNSYEFESRVL